MNNILLIAFFLSSFTSSDNINSNECDCHHIVGIEDAKTVFKGTILSIKQIDSPFFRYEVLFRVKKKIKGNIKNKTTVNVNCLLEACCGIPFKKGESYIIYTYDNHKGLPYTGFCTQSQKL